MTVGEIIRRIRLRAGQPQRAMAGRLGITHVHLCNVEQGKSGASLELLDAVYAAYGWHPLLLSLLSEGADVDEHARLVDQWRAER